MPLLSASTAPVKKPGQQDDGQRSDADGLELFDDVVAIERPRHGAANRRAAQADVLLHLECRRCFDPLGQEAKHAAAARES